MSNKVFSGLDTFYTKTSYDKHTGILTVSNESGSNTFDVSVVKKVSYNDLSNTPEVIVRSGQPDFTLTEDSIYIDSDTGKVWSGTTGINLKMRDPDINGLILDKYEGSNTSYADKIIRADDGNLYVQLDESTENTPTETKLIGTPVLDMNENTFDKVTFDSLTISSVYYFDRDTIGIIDETAQTTYSYVSRENRLGLVNIGKTKQTINGTTIAITENVLGLDGVPYSFTLPEGAVVKPYYDSIVVVTGTTVLVLEPAGDIISSTDIEHLIAPIISDINITQFMYIDGLLAFFSITQNKYYVVDLVSRTILENSTTFDIAGKDAVLLDNGYIYYINDSAHMYGFYALDVAWQRVGLDDILPSQFCNSLKLTDVISIENKVASNIKNANGGGLVRAITAFNGFIYLNDSNTPTKVSKVAGINTMTTTARTNSGDFTHEIISLTMFKGSVAVAEEGNTISLLNPDTLLLEASFDMTDLIDGDIISLTSLPDLLYVLTDANNLYVFDKLHDSNPIAVYILDISGGMSDICAFNASSFALTDIDGVSTGVYEMRINKIGEVQISRRIVIKNITYPTIFTYLDKLAVMNGSINTDVSMYNLNTELRRM